MRTRSASYPREFHRSRIGLAAILMATTVAATLAGQHTNLDLFLVDQGPISVDSPFDSDESTATNASILGGERYLILDRLSGTGTTTAVVAGGKLTVTNAAGTASVLTIFYDGTATMPGDVDPLGLGGVDWNSVGRALSFSLPAVSGGAVEVWVEVLGGVADVRLPVIGDQVGATFHARPSVGLELYDLPFPLLQGSALAQDVTAAAGALIVGLVFNGATTLELSSLAVSSPTLGCGLPPVQFEAGLPANWNATGSGLNWTTTADPACSIESTSENRTDGAGHAACADSDAAGSGAGPYVAFLHTPSLLRDPELVARLTLEFRAHYRDIGLGNDSFELIDWNAGTGSELFTWDETHDGEVVSVPLPLRQGSDGVAFLYSGDGYDWYAQVDEVVLLCEIRSFSDGFESGDTGYWSVVVE